LARGIEEIFLIYVNLSEKNNPESLRNVFEVASKHVTISKDDMSRIDYIIDNMMIMSKADDMDAAKELIKNPKPVRNYTSWVSYSELPEMAFDAVCGYVKEKCSGCFPGLGNLFDRTELWKYTPDKKVKNCFECDQLLFSKMLSQIASGVDLDDVLFGELNALFIKCNEQIHRTVLAHFKYEGSSDDKIVQKNLDIFRIKNPIDYNLKNGLLEFFSWHFDEEIGFNANLLSLCGYSLSEFLLRSKTPDRNRKLLHECKRCDAFFISARTGADIKFCPTCSPKSKKTREKRKEYQRKYRKKKKLEKLQKEHEAKILKYMDELGCTREEAGEIIKADSTM